MAKQMPTEDIVATRYAHRIELLRNSAMKFLIGGVVVFVVGMFPPILAMARGIPDVGALVLLIIAGVKYWNTLSIKDSDALDLARDLENRITPEHMTRAFKVSFKEADACFDRLVQQRAIHVDQEAQLRGHKVGIVNVGDDMDAETGRTRFVDSLEAAKRAGDEELLRAAEEDKPRSKRRE
ncbi:hypothetical protein COU79_05005 [Candidatus Peregrinibacteria bacterium CG10_big_fil_rev_8_21_14_0_10_54_7]|nr:MAG: hypothetical protein COU79_05005 [Candidatus Peregrinibacteria bacterium CG10_big_fil_rev_8_21_14_0_10_54_7]